MTLTLKDFVFVWEQKKILLIGLILQFLVMSLSAFLIAKLFTFNTELLIGMVLVGSVAGGTASNVICFIAKANVALSISMTAISTLVGVFLTPVLIQLFLKTSIDVSTSAMILSLVKIVLIPVALGLFLNVILKDKMKSVHSFLPSIAMVAIILIIAIVVSLNKNNLTSLGLSVAVAVILHNLVGLSLGYYVSKMFGFSKVVCKTIAIEVGMQNSGLAVALAIKFFTPLSALAGAIFSIWHNISGSILAGFWAGQDENKDEKK